METTSNFQNSLNQIVKGLGIISFLIIVITGLYLLGVASGSVSASDDSTLGHVVGFLIHRPFIIGAMLVVMIWGYVISLRDEKREKDAEKNYRPARRTGKISIQKPQH